MSNIAISELTSEATSLNEGDLFLISKVSSDGTLYTSNKIKSCNVIPINGYGLKKNTENENITDVDTGIIATKLSVDLLANSLNDANTNINDIKSELSGLINRIKTLEESGGGSSPLVNYYVTTSATPSDGGTVTGGGQSTTYSRTITASPASGFHFVSWSDGDETNPRLVNGNGTYQAIFESDIPRISYLLGSYGTETIQLTGRDGNTYTILGNNMQSTNWRSNVYVKAILSNGETLPYCNRVTTRRIVTTVPNSNVTIYEVTVASDTSAYIGSASGYFTGAS